MAEFTESLTIRIRGDSSEFAGELDRVTARLSDLEARLAAFDTLGQRLASAVGRVELVTQPLNRVSAALARIFQQVQAINSLSISLNVQPALTALQLLAAQVAFVAAQIQALQSLSLGGVFGGFGGFGPVTGFAHGGLVTGRPGFDRIPAMLSAGEFVIRESAVQDLGVQFLNALNEQGARAAQPAGRGALLRDAEEPPSRSGSVTHFGGIQIQVNQATDLHGVLRELQAGGVRLKNRRG